MRKKKDLGGAEIPKAPPARVHSPKQIPFKKIIEILTLVLVGEKTSSEIADQAGVGTKTVQRIRTSIPKEVLQQFGPGHNSEIAELISEQIKQNLLATQRIAKVTEDEVWIKAQRAPELGTFFGIITDKTIRILDSIERANERERISELQERHRLTDTVETIARNVIGVGQTPG